MELKKIANQEVAQIFKTMADAMEIKGENRFRIRAYRNAARSIENLTESLEDILKKGEKDLDELPDIGKSIGEKIEEIMKTGTLKQYEELLEEVPGELTRLVNIPGVGPKTVATLHEKLGINNVEDLKRVCKEGKLEDLEGFGVKTQEKILEGIADFKKHQERFKLSEVEAFAKPLLEHLKKVEGIEKITVCGSYRRRKETVGDLDILVTGDRGSSVMHKFVIYDRVKDVLLKGDTKSSVVLKNGLQVDLRLVEPKSYGAAIMYFTGSKEHNVTLRDRAKDRGYKINEYGVFKGANRVAGQTEEEIYKLMDCDFIAPELRENSGEIEAATDHELPDLIELKQIRGDCQMHTTKSDGKDSVEEMAGEAVELGYEYIAITEHSRAVRVAGGLDEKELSEWIEVLNEKDEKIDGIKVLKGIEVDILENGALDLSENVLKKLDIIVAAVHSHFNQSEEKMTERIIKGIKSPAVNVLAHPTGRLINKREPYKVDMKKVLKAARDFNVYPEINAHPARLDLKDIHCRLAKEMGLKVIINTDAHRIAELYHMRFGVDTARRGWLEDKDVLNTRSLKDLLRTLNV